MGQGSYGQGNSNEMPYWICPNDETTNTGDKCIICGHPRPPKRKSWICPDDGCINTGKNCVVCGSSQSRKEGKNLKCCCLITFAVIVFLCISKLGTQSPTPPTTPAQEGSTGVTHQHNWVDATYNSPRTCSTCSETEGSKKTPTARLHLANIITDASSSSIMYGSDEYSHHPNNLFDYNKQTNWTEGVSGYGLGEFVLLRFDKTYAINEFTILIGSHYQKDSTYFEKNSRPSAITLTFSDERTKYIQLDDSRDYQTFYFSEFYYTDYVKITIEDVYPGTHWDETIIAEVDFSAYIP